MCMELEAVGDGRGIAGMIFRLGLLWGMKSSRPRASVAFLQGLPWDCWNLAG